MNTSENTGRLWIRLMKKHRVAKSIITECTRDNPEDALQRILPTVDLGQPLWLPRHQADWTEYAMTRFMPDHFVEAFPFDSMEISYIYPEDEDRPGRRRNPWEDA
ncbi:MAG: hypothetical protein E7331_07975 [Clostridiales bacterium]|nr:hypothetical protein [Clostridiales bacterium]